MRPLEWEQRRRMEVAKAAAAQVEKAGAGVWCVALCVTRRAETPQRPPRLSVLLLSCLWESDPSARPATITDWPIPASAQLDTAS